MKRRFLPLLLTLCTLPLGAQLRYFNPVLHQDYSDPDVCRVGEDYYMTASSFNCFPGLPILHSRDLVNWEPIGAALPEYEEAFQGRVEHGNGVWAPAIRHHDGWFYIFCGDPDRGIFMVRAPRPEGPWEKPVWVVKGKGLIDPCPFWDEDGKAYLSHAAAGSRAGLKSVVFMAPMAPDGTHLTGPSRIVFDGHRTQPTIEGTKMYKRDGWYYLFCPAGGVATGWQSVLRARQPFGPYEDRVVMAWTEGSINGPHQGAWVETPQGHWFLHFQDKGAYGRIVHLQPLHWGPDGWPVIGEDPDGDGIGAPVEKAESPFGTTNAVSLPPSSAGPYGLDLCWQYPCVPSPYWHAALPGGDVRLFSVPQSTAGLWDCPNLLLRKFPAERFTVTARLRFRPHPQREGEQAGMVIMGNDYASLRLTNQGRKALLQWVVCRNAHKGGAETVTELGTLPFVFQEENHPYSSGNVPAVNYPSRPETTLWVLLDVRAKAVEGNVPEAVCRVSYSTDGKRYTRVPGSFTARPEAWIGAKFGFYCNRPGGGNDAGWLDITRLRIQPQFDPLQGFNYEEASVPAYTLPDVLTTEAGKPVNSVRTWEKVRRGEILRLFEEKMYGRAPAAPKEMHFRLLSCEPALEGRALRKEVRIFFDAAESQYLTLLLYTPSGATKPVPTFLGINFFGNHTLSEDPGVSLPDTLRYRPDFTLDARGSQAHRWPLRTILEQGFGVATFCCEDIDPDQDDGFHNGIHGLLDRQRDKASWGTLAAWAWGLSRALDYLETDPQVDGRRVAVFGHSRMGKAALWAGALDPRFAMVISNASGCGGAALSRRHYGETLRRINIRFPHWYCRNFHDFSDNEDYMPFDQHELLALIAPRPLYVESGSEDRWSDPYGEYLSLVEASRVYRLYGYEAFESRELPPVESPEIHGVTGYHIRQGKHEILLYDWEQYLHFARQMWP